MSAPFASPPLTPVRRVRVLVRRTLFAVLRAVPGRLVLAVHDRSIEPSGRRRRRWRPLATALFYRPVPATHFVVPGGDDRMAVVGSRLERVLWWYGEQGYEHGEALRWRALCAEAIDVLEVGANVGYYTVVGARATRGTYTTVEPNPEAADAIRRNLALNGLSSTEVIQAAVVGHGAPAEIELAFPDQEAHSVAPTGSFLVEGTESVADRAAHRSIVVPTVQAGPLFAGRDLVKLDIEGSEAAVLEAAADEILRSRPIILVEVLRDAVRLREIIAGILTQGYELQSLDDRGTTPTMDGAADRDVLLVPVERRDAV